MNHDPKSSHTEEFTHHGKIEETLAYGETNRTSRELIDKILARAGERRGLTHREAMAFLDCGSEDKSQEIYELAEQIKKDSCGNRTVLFAPLYLFNYCINGCVYYPYYAKNKHTPRKKLTQDEIRREIMTLQDMEHKHPALETGEGPVHNLIKYMLESIDTTYSIEHKNGAIRRVNVNIVATTMENYRKLKDTGIGTHILLQEACHKENYEKLHPTGPKHDYCYRTEAMNRAQLNGIDDVGCGVLLGLEPYRYKFVGLLMRAEHLRAVFGVGPHTIGMPRIRRADNIDLDSFDNGADDDTFAKLMAYICIVVPYIGTIVSTRESQKTREWVLYLDTSQVSGDSKIGVDGYFEPEPEEKCSAQFDVGDNRTLDQVVNWLVGMEYIPSFCTACYREGRTGDRFVSLCKSGRIQNRYHPNTPMTLKEYLMDYSSEGTRRIGEVFIKKEAGGIPKKKVQQIAKDSLAKIEQGIRDSRF